MTELEKKLALEPDYLPPCPDCSRHKAVRGPSFRWARHSGGFHLSQCASGCMLSKESPIVQAPEMPIGAHVTQELRKKVAAEQLAARVVVANWWKMQRQSGKAEMLEFFRQRGLTAEMEATK